MAGAPGWRVPERGAESARRRDQVKTKGKGTYVIWGIAIPIFLFLFSFLESESGGFVVLKRIENYFLDRRMLFWYSRSGESPVILLEIDEKSKKEIPDLVGYSGSVGILDRRVHAEAVRRLTEMGASVIAYDLIFDEHSSPEADREFAKAIRESGKVVLASYIDPGSLKMAPLYAPFLQAGALVGYASHDTDFDGVVRRAPLVSHGERHFAMKIMERFRRDERVVRRILERGNRCKIRYFNAPGVTSYRGNFRHFSYYDFLRGKLSKDAIAANIVLIGDKTLEAHDYFSTPLDRHTYGMYINAFLIDTLLARGGRGGIFEPPSWVNLFIALFCGMVSSFVAGRFSLSSGWFWPPIVWLGAFAFPFFLYSTGVGGYKGIEANMAIPFLTVPLVFAGVGAHRYLTVEKEGMRIKASFESYVSPEVLREILNKKDLLTPEGSMKEMTVLFTDIRGFTTLSEQLHPQEVVALLRSYFELVGEAVLEHGGHLNKFIGDGIMALFSIPPKEDDPVRAFQAALRIVEEVGRFNERQAKEGKIPLKIGIGLNTGPVIWGEVGFKKKLDYTAIGDTVNTASRIEALTKQYPCPILMGQSTWERIARAGKEVSCVCYGEVEIRGKAGKMTIYGPGKNQDG